MATITLSLQDPQPTCPDSGGEVPAISDSLVLSLDPAKYSSTPTNPVVAQITSITPNPTVYDCWEMDTGPGQDYELIVADIDLPFVGGVRVTDIDECDLLAKPICSSCCSDHDARLDAIEAELGGVTTENVAALTTLTNPGDGVLYQTQGWYAAHDGGANLYRYDQASSAVCDGGFIVDGVGGDNTPAATLATYAGTGVGRFIAVDQGISEPKQFGVKADGSTDDTVRIQAFLDSIPNIEETIVTARVDVDGQKSIVSLPNTLIKQGDAAELAEVLYINFGNSPDDRAAELVARVDGNRDNNTASVTGIGITTLKRLSNYARLSAVNCDVGVFVRRNVEYAKLEVDASSCGVGLRVDPDGGATPDELDIRLSGNGCGTFFESSGDKTSGHVIFSCEQSDSWAADISHGWYEIGGVIRGCGNLSGGGLRVRDNAKVTGNIRIVGNHAVNCEWGASFPGGPEIQNLQVTIAGLFKDGFFIEGGATGSARLVCQEKPAATGSEKACQMGVNGGTNLVGFNLLPGTVLKSDNIALDLDNARYCTIDLGEVEGEIVLGASALQNTIYISRADAETVSITNNATGDNKIVFRGSYFTAVMNGLNGGTLWEGMEVESAIQLNGARAYYDGAAWTAY